MTDILTENARLRAALLVWDAAYLTGRNEPLDAAYDNSRATMNKAILATPAPDAVRGAARTRLLEKALTVAMGNLAPQQPGDSRAVDDWFVACAAVQAELDDADGKIERCLDDALALLTQEGR